MLVSYLGLVIYDGSSTLVNFLGLFPVGDMGLFPGSSIQCLDGGSQWLSRCEDVHPLLLGDRGPFNCFGVGRSWPNAEAPEP